MSPAVPLPLLVLLSKLSISVRHFKSLAFSSYLAPHPYFWSTVSSHPPRCFLWSYPQEKMLLLWFKSRLFIRMPFPLVTKTVSGISCLLLGTLWGFHLWHLLVIAKLGTVVSITLCILKKNILFLIWKAEEKADHPNPCISSLDVLCHLCHCSEAKVRDLRILP